jgi:hypothetical protein
VRILNIDTADLSALGTLSSGSVQAVSLNVPLQVMLSDPPAVQALMQWVREGGTVLLHTDAAQLFGYRTVAPRAATNAVAGQSFGRARAALPFGANPLLWSLRGAPSPPGAASFAGAATVQAPAGTVRAAPLTNVPAVRLVYYQMAPDDHLAYGHPSGIPLLRVADITGNNPDGPLYAAALASYGRGWAFFSPSLVEQHRADGAAFVQGLLRLISVSPRGTGAAPSAGAATGPAGMFGFPSPPNSSPRRRTPQRRGGFDAAAFLGPFALAVFGGDTDENPDAVPPLDANAVNAAQAGTASTLDSSTAGLIMSRREADAMARLLNRARGDNVSRARAITALYLLRLRLELQRENLDAAATWLTAAQRVAGAAAETLLWRGAMAVDDAEELSNAAPVRAERWREAATVWNAALSAPSLYAAGVLPARDNISGAPRAFVQAWVSGAVAAANRAAGEPPLVQVVSSGASDITLRHNGDHAGLQNIVPSLQRWMPSPVCWAGAATKKSSSFFPISIAMPTTALASA